ncbi:response regulator [Methylobacterium sp. R2-1]|uniref:response regulator n=1 Tax=Methylobacterium sp. R2-1 TaxID=2587064 RepID=UPI0016227629|nr:response regulator [Methylobacterium sp. R2-1]MBB2961199.1 CheY-like chemotaxis protein [Methylobacterium sp. R2-1]
MSSATTVLIVEDNYLLLEMLTRLCEREGMRVLAASSGEAALTALRDEGESIDWLFTDIVLPGLIDGWTVASAYRERYPQRPIVYASTTAQVESRTVPGSFYLRKPFETREVLELAGVMAARPSESRSRVAG